MTVEQRGREAFSYGAKSFLEWASAEFSELSLAPSFGLEDMVLIDMAARLGRPPRIFMLDTGRLHQETYEIVDQVRRKYELTIQVYTPESGPLEDMLTKYGMNHFYESSETRKACCEVRKVQPLKKALKGQEAWIVGLRRGQSKGRGSLEPITWDESLWKLSPLADYSLDDVWNYIRTHKVPYNPLHNKGYPTIGCAPCTRAISPGEDIRAGRWWWEGEAGKECGLHDRKKEALK